jgi:2'-deoxynucleoside 5'-phosphate N-hydrolase
MKKIYFAGSIRGGRDDTSYYQLLISYIASLDCTVLTEHIGLKDIKAMGEEGKTEQWIYERDMAWLTEADAIVAEVTNPSLGVGYEIAKAEDMNKPILCLFRPSAERKLSAMIVGSPNLVIHEYASVPDAEQAISDFVDKLSATQPVA